MKVFARQGKCSFVSSSRGHEVTQLGVPSAPALEALVLPSSADLQQAVENTLRFLSMMCILRRFCLHAWHDNVLMCALQTDKVFHVEYLEP